MHKIISMKKSGLTDDWKNVTAYPSRESNPRQRRLRTLAGIYLYIINECA